MSELENRLHNLRNQIKNIDFIGDATIEIKESISSLLSARIRLGQTLYFSYKGIQRRRRNQKISLSQFIKAIAFANPRIKYRTYQRAYRIYQRLIIETGLWIEDLETVDFIILSRIAEGKNLTPYNRRDMVDEVLKMMANGFSYRDTSKYVTDSLKFYKDHPEKWPEHLEKADHRMVDVKLDFGLADSEIDKMEPPYHGSLPNNYFDNSMPHVDKNWIKEQMK